MTKKLGVPKYHKIAIDIASKIATGDLLEGDKIYASSTLAGRYAVSSETARRAIHILVDLGIVSAKKGAGIYVTSFPKAVDYIQQNKSITTLMDLRDEMSASVSRQKKELEYFNEKMNELLERTENLRSENPFIPQQIHLTEDALHLGETIGEMAFWHNTLATIVAIRRGDTLIMSPGPYESIQAHDTVFFFGKNESLQKVKLYFFGE